MKALLLNFNLKGVGTYRRTYYFSRELARHGWDATMVTVSQRSKYKPLVYYKRDWLGEHADPKGEGPWVRVIEAPGLGYKWLPGWSAGPLDLWLRLREVIGGGYDIVYGFEHKPNVAWPVYLTSQFKPYRFYSDWCDWFAGASSQFRGIKLAHEVDRFFEDTIRLFARKVTVTSRLLHQRALGIGVKPERLVQVPEGAATDYIQPLPQAEMRRHFNLPLDRPIVLCMRALDMLAETRVAAEVLKQVPEALFLFLGKPAAEGQALAQRLGIEKSIVNTGWVTDEDFPRYLACSDVCYAPLEDSTNDRARWPAKVLDFLTAGRPVVTNPVGEVGPLFAKDEIGRAVGYTPGVYAAAIVELLRDADLRHQLGENARRVMVNEWDWRTRGATLAQVVSN